MGALFLAIPLSHSQTLIPGETGLTKEQKSWLRKIKRDKSLWPEYYKPLVGKPKTPIKIENRDIVVLSNKKGKPSAFGHAKIDAFVRQSLLEYEKLGAFEKKIDYENIQLYKEYFPEKIRGRLAYDASISNSENPGETRGVSLLFNEKYQFVKEQDEKLFFTNDRLQSQGISSLPLSLFHTDILYRTRENVAKTLAPYLEKIELAQVNTKENSYLTWESLEDNLVDRNTFQYATTVTQRHFVHTKRLRNNTTLVFPPVYEVSKSNKANRIHKFSFPINYSLFSESYYKEPKRSGDDYIIEYENFGTRVMPAVFMISLDNTQPLGKSVPYNWDLFVELTDNWKIIDHHSNQKLAVDFRQGNVIHFKGNQLMDTTLIRVRVRRIQVEEDAPSPPPLQQDDSEVNRKIFFKRTFYTKKEKARLVVFDYEEEDGDIISVYLNNQLIYKDIEVREKPQELEFNLKEGENILKITAENEGSKSPNTAQISYKGAQLKLKNKKGKSSYLKFEYTKKYP